MAEFCRRCGAEIVTANLMDIDPGVDRAHFALVLTGYRRRQLSATEWRLFAALYRRHGRVVPDVELTRAARIPAYALPEHRLLRCGFFPYRARARGTGKTTDDNACQGIARLAVGAALMTIPFFAQFAYNTLSAGSGAAVYNPFANP